jgi:hypothetical protein
VADACLSLASLAAFFAWSYRALHPTRREDESAHDPQMSGTPTSANVRVRLEMGENGLRTVRQMPR